MGTKTAYAVLVAAVLMFYDETVPAQTWSTAATMPTARVHFATEVIGGKFYAAGGNGDSLNALEIYDPAMDAWTTGTPIPTARFGLAGAAVDGKLYAFGGDNWWGTVGSTAEIYDPATDTWANGAPMPTARKNLAVGAIGGKLYALGGASTYGPSFLNTLEIYDPTTNAWTTGAPMPTPPSHFAVGVIGSRLYAVGGYYVSKGEGHYPDSLEIYDPATNTWTTGAPIPTPRAGLAAGVIGGKLYAVGGSYGGSLTTVEIYDPATNTWEMGVPMPVSAAYFAAGVINGSLYAVGCGDWERNIVIRLDLPVATTAFAPKTPASASLSQNAPNPFNPATTIRFALPEAHHVWLAVYDVRGAMVRILVDRPVAAGPHQVVWDGRDGTGRAVASGVYVYRLTLAQGVVTKKMVLAR